MARQSFCNRGCEAHFIPRPCEIPGGIGFVVELDAEMKISKVELTGYNFDRPNFDQPWRHLLSDIQRSGGGSGGV